MARITCEPCEIIPVCNCCHEILCYCSKNKVFQCDDPCFPVNQEHFPGGAPLPFFIEGMVADPNILEPDNHAAVGPAFSSIPLDLSGWDLKYNLFDYQFIFHPSTPLSPYGSYTNDLSNCEVAVTSIVNNTYFSHNENLKPQINTVVNELLSKSADNFTGYIPCGVAGGPVFPMSDEPYNEIDYFLLRSGSRFENSLSEELLNNLNLIDHKSVTSYNFSSKYKKAIAKSILFGYFDTYFYNGKFDLIKEFSEKMYKTKAVPEIQITPRFAGQYTLDPTSVPVTNLENIKTYIDQNRIRFHSGGAGQRLSNKILKQYWKFIPSDIDLRVKIYVDGRGPNILNSSGAVIAGSGTPRENTIRSIRVNDDDTIPVHTLANPNVVPAIPAGKARVHYIDAEHLRVFNNSGAHVYLDDTPMYQEGCGCCTSGCFMSLCSDRDRSYVFDTMDRSALLGLAGSVSGFPTKGFDSDPYIKISVSAPFSKELEFDPNSATSSLKDFYLLTPFLSGTDILSGVVNPSNSYVKTTSLEYKLVATSYGLNTQKEIDRAVRFKSGPGNIFYISNEDPIFYYLNYLDTYEGKDLTASAEIPDLNIDGLLETTERYPRRIPCHILIVPTDQPIQNPLYGKSLITKMVDPGDYTYSPREDGIIRTLKMVPAPIEEVLDSTYLSLVENQDASLQYGYLPYGYGESDKLPFGPQGTAINPAKMQFTASNIYESFTNWQGGEEVSRRVDSVRKIFNFLTTVSSNYDIRTDVTNAFGVYPYSIVYDRPDRTVPQGSYQVVSNYSLPLFDIWRYLNQWEFHEFVYSLNDTIFQKLMMGEYRGIQLYHIPIRFPEKTYLHNYIPGFPTWDLNFPEGLETYAGNIENPRNAAGIDFIENALFMDTVKERNC